MIDVGRVCATLLWTNLTIEEALDIVLNRPVFDASDELTAEEFCLIHVQVFECDMCLVWHLVPDSIVDPDIGALCIPCSVRIMVKRHGRRAIEHALRIVTLQERLKEPSFVPARGKAVYATHCSAPTVRDDANLVP